MKYKVTEHEEVIYESSIVDFLNDLPYVISNKGFIPPQNVLNSIFCIGVLNAGMGGIYEWEPFDINKIEYNNIVSYMVSTRQCLIKTDVPKWVHDYNDWLIWEMDFNEGVPSKKHRKLSQIVDDLKHKRDKAHAEGDMEETHYFDALYGVATMALTEFIDKNSNKFS